jgi:hypothetical protein
VEVISPLSLAGSYPIIEISRLGTPLSGKVTSKLVVWDPHILPASVAGNFIIVERKDSSLDRILREAEKLKAAGVIVLTDDRSAQVPRKNFSTDAANPHLNQEDEEEEEESEDEESEEEDEELPRN